MLCKSFSAIVCLCTYYGNVSGRERVGEKERERKEREKKRERERKRDLYISFGTYLYLYYVSMCLWLSEGVSATAWKGGSCVCVGVLNGDMFKFRFFFLWEWNNRCCRYEKLSSICNRLWSRNLENIFS